MRQTIPLLTLFYDSHCPLCSKEVAWLRSRNNNGYLDFQDIHNEGYNFSEFGLTKTELLTKMHAITTDGSLLTGLDVFAEAYSLVGLPWLAAPLKSKATRPLFNWLYHLFVRYRHYLSWLWSRKVCLDNQCSINDWVVIADMKSLLSTLSYISSVGCSLIGIRTAQETKFVTISRERHFEIRCYPPIVVAKTDAEGDYRVSGNIAFQRLAGYLFGGNAQGIDIPMTAPVYREASGSAISMYATVLQSSPNQRWKIVFCDASRIPLGYLANTAQW